MEPFGKYQLIRRIGAGGMAEVFLARTTVAQGLAKELVIKKIHPAYARAREFVSMFVAEARIALGLNHPNIVQVFDFGQVGDTFFLAMEHIEGVDLLRLLQETVRQRRRIPLSLCAHIVQEMCKGLDYAHRKTDDFGEPLGIVHRDVSPQNVLVSWDGAVKIVDFGIARARGMDEDEGVIKGKYSYMSPEQARGEAVDRRSDVYSAGVVLHELSCGRPLFPGRGKEVLARVKAGSIPRPRLFYQDIPESLEETILRALALSAKDRFGSARDLQLALSRFQFEQAQSARDLIDSEALARFLAEVVPAELRHARAPRPTPAADAGGQSAREQARDAIDAAGGAPLLTDPAALERIDTDTPGDEPAPAGSDVRARKHVMVLEGHVRGLPALQKKLGAPRASKVAAQFSAVARDIAFKHDGYVHQTADDSVTILVGLPVASEDDATRTIRLALALIDALDGIGHDVEPELRLAVGIQRGVAMVVYRDSRAGKAELAASERNMARRLARQAPSAEILVGSQVFRLARSEWNFESVGLAAAAAGRDSEVEAEDAQQARVYRLRGPKERADRLRERAAGAHAVVGRDLELKALRDAYRDVSAAGGTRPLVLVGDAGIGKRTLVNAFLAGTPRNEAVIMRATTQVATLYTPFALLADLARDLLNLAEGAEPHVIKRRLERVMPLIYAGQADTREARAAIAAVSILLRVHARTGTPEFDAEEIRERMLQVVARIRRYMEPKRPIIVIGEDLHWADDDSLGLLRDMFRLPTRRPILAVFTARPDERVERFAREVSAEVMPLGELDPESSLKLISRRFAPDTDAGGGSPVAELARQILARTGGNPLFIHEVLDSLIDRGIVAVLPRAAGDDGAADHDADLLRWVDRNAPIQVPTSVETLLATRIDRLPLSQKQALLHAAIFGRACRADAVTALLGRDARADLEALAARGLLSGGDDQLTFRNDMIMTVTYGLVPAEDRPRLHRQAADIIRAAPPHAGGQDDAVIARHLELAGDAGEAADLYMTAAAAAMDVGGNSDALRQLTRALKLLPADDHARRFVVHGQRERIQRRLARRSRQLSEIRHMRDAADALGDPDRLAQAHLRLAQYYVDVGKAQPALAAIEHAIEHARAARDVRAETEGLVLRATVARLIGNSDEALRLCDQALGLCDDIQDGLSLRASILNARGSAQWSMARLEAAIESFAEALVIYRMLELPRQEARALNNMGIVFANMGEYEEALGHYKSALEIDHRLGDRGNVAGKLSNIGQGYADLGDLERAEHYLRKAIKLAEQVEDAATTVDATVSLGQVQLQRGDAERAMPLLTYALELANESRDPYQEIRALNHLTLARLQAGYEAEELLELVQVAADMAERVSTPVGLIQALAVRGLVLAAMGRAGDAADATAKAVALQAAQQRPVNAEEIFYHHATLCEQAGRRKDAEAALAAAWREIESKAGRLQDAELKAMYLGSRTPRAIAEARERIVGARPG